MKTGNRALFTTEEHSEQLRALLERIDSLDEKVGDLQTSVSTIPTETPVITPGMVNLADNTDYGFRDTDYISATYSTPDSPDNVLSRWYVITQGSGSLPVETTPTVESGQSIVTGSGNVRWNKPAGTLEMSGGYFVLSPLRKNYAYRGAEMVVRLQATRNGVGAFGSHLRLRVAIYDGTSGQNKIIQGQPVALSATAVGSNTGVTRSYIIEVITNNGSFFSNVSSPATATTVATGAIDNSNYVSLSWPIFPESDGHYRIWRSASDVSGGYRLIAEIFSGATTFKDKGGIPSTQYAGTGTTPSQVNAQAIAYIDDFGENLVIGSFTNFVFTIRIPTTYDPSVTTGKQFLTIELLKSDNSFTTTSDVAAGELVVDKVGLSYTNGRWLPSAHDQEVQATIQATNPPISNDPGGGGGNPNPGDGGVDTSGGCFVASTLVTVMDYAGNRIKIPIVNVQPQMKVLSVDEQGNATEGIVAKRVQKTTSKLYEFCTVSGKSVVCSPTQPFITYAGDKNGKKAFSINTKDKLLTLSDGEQKASQEEIAYIESWDSKVKVYSLELTDKNRTFVANDLVVHNVFKKGL
jgi:hypothetical protein